MYDEDVNLFQESLKKLKSLKINSPIIMKLLIVCVTIFSFYLMQLTASNVDFNETEKYPTFVIVTLFRNKAHTLPYFFTYLEQLDYPKSRITLW